MEIEQDESEYRYFRWERFTPDTGPTSSKKADNRTLHAKELNAKA